MQFLLSSDVCPIDGISIAFISRSKLGVLRCKICSLITAKFCTCHDSVTVVTCAKFRCDQLNMLWTRALQNFIKFQIPLKYQWDGCQVRPMFYLSYCIACIQYCVLCDHVIKGTSTLYGLLLNVGELYTIQVMLVSTYVLTKMGPFFRPRWILKVLGIQMGQNIWTSIYW